MERGDIGLKIALVPKVLSLSYLIRCLKNFEYFCKIKRIKVICRLYNKGNNSIKAITIILYTVSRNVENQYNIEKVTKKEWM